MKTITLHKVDKPTIIKDDYEWRLGNYDSDIDSAKKKFNFLFIIYKNSLELLQMSVTEKADLKLQKKWFNYGLNCISEACRLAHFEGKQMELQIDDTGKFKLLVEKTDAIRVSIATIYFAIISRNHEKINTIINAPDSSYNYTATNLSHIYSALITKLFIEYFKTGKFNTNIYNDLDKIHKDPKSNIKPDLKTNFTIYCFKPQVMAFKCLVDNNQKEFNNNLINAINAHKGVWGQNKRLIGSGTPMCRENHGFISWGCTAFAAMAFDKGWKLEVESDYMPAFMIDGSINK